MVSSTLETERNLDRDRNRERERERDIRPGREALRRGWEAL